MSIKTHYTMDRIDLARNLNRKSEYGHYKKVDEWVRAALHLNTNSAPIVLIIGSCDQGFGPWYEEMVRAEIPYPRLFVTDYNQVSYESPIVTYLPPKLLDKIKPDIILSISTFEHSGLGRYGDEINESADLEAMDNARRLLKPDGMLILAVPIGMDKTVENLHRIYGSKRLPELLFNWTIVATYGFEGHLLDRDTKGGWEPVDDDGKPIHPEMPEYSPVFVLKKAQ